MQGTFDAEDTSVGFEDVSIHWVVMLVMIIMKVGKYILTLGKPERYEVDTVRKESSTSMNEFTELFENVSDLISQNTYLNLTFGTASTKCDETKSVTHFGGSCPN